VALLARSDRPHSWTSLSIEEGRDLHAETSPSARLVTALVRAAAAAAVAVLAWHGVLLLRELRQHPHLVYRPVNGYTVALAVAVSWALAALTFVLRRSTAALILLAAASVAATTAPLVPAQGVMVVFGASLFVLGWHPNATVAVAAQASVVFAATVMHIVLLDSYQPLVGAMSAFLAGGFSWVVHHMLVRWDRSLMLFDQARWAAARFADANMRLQDSMGTAEVTALDEERVRLAREVHDIVGHNLTAALVQIATAKELAGTDRDATVDALRALEDSVRSALKDVREEVSELRRPSAGDDWRVRWIRLCARFARSTGVRVYTNVGRDLAEPDGRVGEAVYRIIQEALTNAYRHGSATVIDVSMLIRDGRLLLRVSDNGYGCEPVRPGNGLNGIRERVAELGGEVAWKTEPHAGFDLGVAMPLAARELAS
jgi:signal transduction histidine kinase